VDVPAWRALRIFSSDALDARSRDTASTAPVLMAIVCQGSRLKGTRQGGRSRRAAWCCLGLQCHRVNPSRRMPRGLCLESFATVFAPGRPL